MVRETGQQSHNNNPHCVLGHQGFVDALIKPMLAKDYKLPVIRPLCSGDVVYSVVITVRNNGSYT